MARNWFGHICVVLFYISQVSANLLPISPMQIFLHSVHVMQQMTFTEIRVKWSVTLADRLSPEILTILEILGHVLHRVHLYLKVLGWLSDFNALLTRTLPTLQSRLNKMSGDRGNKYLVWGSLQRILKFLRMTFLIAWFCEWQVRVIGILLVSSFCDVCSAVSRSISWARCLRVVTAESG